MLLLDPRRRQRQLTPRTQWGILSVGLALAVAGIWIAYEFLRP